MTHKPIYYSPEQKILVGPGPYPEAAKPGMVIGPYRRDDGLWYETDENGNELKLFPGISGGATGQILTYNGTEAVWTVPPTTSFNAVDSVIGSTADPAAAEGTLAVVSGVLGLNDGNVYVSDGSAWVPYHVATTGEVITIPGAGAAEWSGTQWAPTANPVTDITPSTYVPVAGVLVSDHVGPADWVVGEANQVLAMNATGDGVEFRDNPVLAGGNPNQVLSMDASGTNPIWVDPAPGTIDTNYFIPASTFAGQLFYSTAAGDVNATASGGGGNGSWLTPGTANQILTISAAGLPVWSDNPASALEPQAIAPLEAANLGTSGQFLAVNAAATGTEWVDNPASGLTPATVAPLEPGNLGTTGQVLTVNATADGTVWSDVPPGYDLPDATGLSIPYATGAGDPQTVQAYLAPGTANQVLAVNATGDGFVWQAVSALASSYDLPDATAAGQIAYFNAAGDPSTTQSYLSIGTTNQVLTVSAAGLPTWTDNPASALEPAAIAPLEAANLGTSGQFLAVNAAATGTEWVDNPASALSPTAITPLQTGNLGTAGQILTVNPGANGTVWADAPAGYDLPDATGLSIPYATAAGDPQTVQAYLAPGTGNQVLAMNAAGDAFVWQSLAALTTSYDLLDATAKGQIVVMSAAGDPSSAQGYLDIGTAGQVLTVNAAGDFPEWTDPAAAPAVFTGATLVGAGTSGLVPAPDASDHIKYLTGAGTWESPPTYDLPDAAGLSIPFANAAGDPSSVQSYLLAGNAGEILTVNAAGDGFIWTPPLEIPGTYDLPDPTGVSVTVMVGAGDPSDMMGYVPIGQPDQVFKVNTNGTAFEFGNPDPKGDLTSLDTDPEALVYEHVQLDGTGIRRIVVPSDFDVISLCEFMTDETVVARDGLVFYQIPPYQSGVIANSQVAHNPYKAYAVDASVHDVVAGGDITVEVLMYEDTGTEIVIATVVIPNGSTDAHENIVDNAAAFDTTPLTFSRRIRVRTSLSAPVVTANGLTVTLTTLRDTSFVDVNF